MRILKTLTIVFCCCGLITTCGNEPNDTTDHKAVDNTTELATTLSESVTPELAIDTLDIDTINEKTKQLAEEKKQEAADKVAVAAAEAQEKEEADAKEKKEIAAKKKERREKRRAAEKESKIKESSKDAKGKAAISFEKMVHNYGRISQGEKIKHNFTFKNIGNKELVISNATASCGCTQPSFPFMPISPGEQGYIGVVFDSKGKLGRQKPKITITTNANPATYDIYLEGTVDSDDAEKEKKEETEGEN